MNIACGDADVLHPAFVPESHQRVDCSSCLRDHGEVVVFRIVQEEQRKYTKPEPLLTLIKRASHPITGVVTVSCVHFGDHRKVLWHSPRGSNADADPALALAFAVSVGGIEGPNRTLQYLLDEIDGIGLRDRVAVKRQHGPKGGSTRDDCRGRN